MHPSAQRVQEALHERGFTGQVVELEASTRTAAEAAQAAGCAVGQIVKSLIFRLEQSNKPVLILVSGDNRVHEKRLGRLIGDSLVRPDADFVHEISGYAIGGIPPVGHKTPLETYLDEDLQQYDVIWAAAGTPNAVFAITPAELVRITGAQVICVK